MLPLAGHVRPHTCHPACEAQLTVVSLMMVMVRVSYHCRGDGGQAGGWHSVRDRWDAGTARPQFQVHQVLLAVRPHFDVTERQQAPTWKPAMGGRSSSRPCGRGQVEA